MKSNTRTIENMYRVTLCMAITSSIIILVYSFTYFVSSHTVLSQLAPEGMQAALLLATETRKVSSPFYYNFNVPGTLHEASAMDRSSSPYFWLNSGGKLILESGMGKTIQGDLPNYDLWNIRYALSSGRDTDNGKHPQNLFRLVTRSTWENVEQSIRFNIRNINITDTPNRDGWSGILLMSRYESGDTLYYAGLRMDGLAVIKKKLNGIYYTLAEGEAFADAAVFDRNTRANLIPTDSWMRLKSVTKDTAEGVTIELWIDEQDNGMWRKLLSVTDTQGKNGRNVIDGASHAGIRTDYMDVWFDDYRLREI